MNHRSFLLWLAVAVFVGACGDDGVDTPPPVDEPEPESTTDPEPEPTPEPEVPSLTPASGSAAGYYEVTLTLPVDDIDPESVTGVTLGGVNAINLTAGDSELTMMVQGHGEGGPVEVVVELDDETTSLGEIFTYDAPLDPRFARVVGIGASLTQGVQRGTPTYHGSLMSPPALIARQMGGWVGLPLFHPEFLPQITTADIGPPPDCVPPSLVDFVTESSAEIFGKLADPESGKFGYQYARVDADIEVRNLAVGGNKLRDIVHGPDEDDLGGNFMSHMVYDPHGEFLGPISMTQLDMAEALKPTLIVTTDLYGNDIINAIVGEDIVDPSDMTELAELEADLEELVGRMAATGAEVFLATLPEPSLLPATNFARKRMKELGVENGEELIAEVEQRAVDANAAMTVLAAQYENVHIVDTYTQTQDLVANGVQVGEHLLTSKVFGGLLGLDGVHFTDTGYAAMSQVFIDAINEALGTDIPPIDLEAIYAADVESRAAYEAAGFDVDACAP